MYSVDETLVSVACIGVRCALATGHGPIIHGARRNGVVVFCAAMAFRRHFESALQRLTDSRDHGALLRESLLSTCCFLLREPRVSPSIVSSCPATIRHEIHGSDCCCASTKSEVSASAAASAFASNAFENDIMSQYLCFSSVAEEKN